ncbi:DUF4291 family protein [Streptomyces sp. NPDC017435]|uniref:DUF4291 family protein n=1 Tax=Streptomyces sp. NPDC017435 TaxID=3364995 RepID=UPI0037A092F4
MGPSVGHASCPAKVCAGIDPASAGRFGARADAGAVRSLFEQEPRFRIRAAHTDSTMTVYQAYRPKIGNAAARDGHLPPAWSRERMRWIIKPRSQPSGA